MAAMARMFLRGLAALLAVALLAQFFIAGMASLTNAEWWAHHLTWVGFFQWLVVPLPVLAWLIGPPRPFRVTLACFPFVQMGLQYVLAHRGMDGRWPIGLGLHAVAIVAAALVLPVGICVTAADLSDFKSPLDGSPMTFKLQPGEVETPAVEKLKETGDNDYRGNAEAIAAGKALYEDNCIICHGADGKGKLGPTLVGDKLIYKQAKSDPGMFSIIYGGASGAMQSFANRGMKQDEMLKIVAYVRTLDK